MSDDDFIRQLQAIFDADDPADGIDRHDGFGSYVRITGLRRVDDGDFAELEVTYESTVPLRWRWRFRGLPPIGTTRVLFDRDWREQSGFATPQRFAPRVAHETLMAATDSAQEYRDRKRSSVTPAEVDADVPGADELWADLVAALRRDNTSAQEVSEGVIEVVESYGDHATFHLHVTPAQWRSHVVACEAGTRNDRGVDAASAGQGAAWAYGDLDETIASRFATETHVVYFKDEFIASIRPELPPVHGSDEEP